MQVIGPQTLGEDAKFRGPSLDEAREPVLLPLKLRPGAVDGMRRTLKLIGEIVLARLHLGLGEAPRA